MTVERLLPTAEAYDLPRRRVPHARRNGSARSAPPEDWGGGGQPYEVYLQVIEELAARWPAVAVAVSVHVLSCHPLIAFGTAEQQQMWLPDMLGGQSIGAYSLSEPQAGSDAAALSCKASAVDGGYRISGAKVWITHGGIADFYSLFPRTSAGGQGISCFLVDKDTEGLSFGPPEQKMGLHAIPTTTAHYDDSFTQIFEGTNQIQRLVIGRSLSASGGKR
ncbi:acyl-CoA dehydrogenase family protein [Mycobacterium sp. 21AC1]|uniref:acyl-CoA dehydrogenase family protein n=1 Tax=[Mycobacterium] appelbergii TaxID=2939269 RepID=UPI0029391052|nr:acyl-CoA dehydrogenase family protein [Mycobacterium sp. 21AC1]MDV3124630.1 acyl-CoA dehydrogenase family protein [Mycobacterium sp. 21AC1]